MKSSFRSNCPIASSLDVIGDKWTMVIIRDLFLGKKTFKEFSNSSEKMSSSILAQRLKSMVQYKIIVRKDVFSNKKTKHYELTESGKSLEPLMNFLSSWGVEHLGEF
jgi:DNA-binding HxlR family transcriptional regulator